MKRSSLFGLLIVIVCVTGCKFQNFFSKSESDAKPGESRKTEPIKASSDPREDIIAASKRFTDQNSFSAKMEMSGSNKMNMDIEYAAPDRFHVKNSASMEFIIIGKDTYLKSNGSWKKFPANLGDSISKMRDAFTEEGMKSLKDVEFSGEESLDGKNALVYKYKGQTVKDANAYTSRLWIGKDNGLPLKIEVDYPDGSLLKQMTTNYDYETKVTIEPPATK
jgi:hypothetical protein